MYSVLYSKIEKGPRGQFGPAPPDPAQREIKWGTLPDGLVVVDKPETLDATLVGMFIRMRWPAPHSPGCWASSRAEVTVATPRIFLKFNYHCTWSDGWTNEKLQLENYGGSLTADYGSWVLLEKAADVREEPV